jgi:hypothetical protein
VIEPLLRPTRSTWNKLRDVERRDFDPLEVLQRACERMLRRFEDPNIYNEGDLSPTLTDIQKGLDMTRGKVDAGRVAALGRKQWILDEKYELIWRDSVPSGAGKAIEGQIRHSKR